MAYSIHSNCSLWKIYRESQKNANQFQYYSIPPLEMVHLHVPVIRLFYVVTTVVTPTEISNTENHKNYYMTEVMCPMGSFKYNYGMWSLDICLDQTP